jgi:hypothetical protein
MAEAELRYVAQGQASIVPPLSSKLLCRRPWRGQLSPDTFRLAEYNILMPRDLPDPGRNTFVAADSIQPAIGSGVPGVGRRSDFSFSLMRFHAISSLKFLYRSGTFDRGRGLLMGKTPPGPTPTCSLWKPWAPNQGFRFIAPHT